MHITSGSSIFQEQLSHFKKPVVQYIVIFILLISAFSVRLYHINRPPLDFTPTRQFQSAHIARGIYFNSNEMISESRRQIANLNMERIGLLLEPRIIENLAVLGYRIAGSEILWLPRVLSSIFWTIGGFFLFLIARRISSVGSAFFAVMFYLFLPYSISASRSFQPDSMMVMMMLASIYTVLWYFEKPSILRILISAVVSSVAILIKPYCLFPIWTVFVFMSIHHKG